jgi:restriction system protein
MEILSGTNNDMHRSAWGSVRNVEWKDEIELKELFESEKLDTQHGKFLDQRFIDFLDRNFEKVDEMHWRKFEGLAGEFFEREGYRVEMGPGRGDGGVDLRVFPKDAGEGDPPLIIVQCKRQKAKIDMVLVKSVYTDVEWEKAKSGLIVTTSTFAPGADRVRTARAYAVEAADRPKLHEWLAKMRSGA